MLCVRVITRLKLTFREERPSGPPVSHPGALKHPIRKGKNKGKNWNYNESLRKRNPGKYLKLLIGLLISCTLFDWFAINSGLWCIKDRGWRQPWSLWTPYTHWEGEGREHQYHVLSLRQDFRPWCFLQLLGLWDWVYRMIHFLSVLKGKWWIIICYHAGGKRYWDPHVPLEWAYLTQVLVLKLN